MAEPQPTLVVLRQRREQTIARLCEHFALDHLEAAELEELIDRAHQATTLAELDELLAPLPSLQPPQPAEAPSPAVHTPYNYEAEHQIVVAVMGGAERKGPWTPARNVYVTAFMGGALLDFRYATFQPGVTEVYVLAIMGGVEIVVPPGMLVESNGIGIMGGFGHGAKTRIPVDSSRPVLRVSGLALMGGVEIKERPHRVEGARDALEPGKRPLPRPEPRDGSGWGGWGNGRDL